MYRNVVKTDLFCVVPSTLKHVEKNVKSSSKVDQFSKILFCKVINKLCDVTNNKAFMLCIDSNVFHLKKNKALSSFFLFLQKKNCMKMKAL